MIDELTKKLIDDSRAILESKKLDPVGKADDDIDNDGDTDSSDEYLKKRRAAISKAMKDEDVEELEKDAKKKEIKEKDVKESTAAWAKSLETLARKKQLDKISDKDKATLVKIAQMLAKEKDVKEEVFFEVTENLSPTSKKFIDMMNDMMKFKHGSKEFKAKKKEIDMFLKKNSGKM